MSRARDDGVQHCRNRKVDVRGADPNIAIVGKVPRPPRPTPAARAGASRPVDGAPGSIPAGHSDDWIVESEHFNKLTGTYSQRCFSVLFNNRELTDSQCVPAGISALSYIHLFPGHRPSKWDRTDLYRILNQANNLYAQYLNVTAGADPEKDNITQTKIKQNGYAMTSKEIKRNYPLFGDHFKVKTTAANLNIIKGVRLHGRASGLEIDLNNLFNGTTAPPAAPPTSTKGALFISCSYSRLVWKSANGKYYIFDSHFYPPSTESLVIETTSVKFLHAYLCKLLVVQPDGTISSRNSRDIANTLYSMLPVEISGPTSKLTPAEHCKKHPTALDKPQRFGSGGNKVPPAELFKAYVTQPETSWTVLAIFDSQVAPNGILRYLIQWGDGNHPLEWIAEKRLQDGAAILLKLHKTHVAHFHDYLPAKNDGSSLDQPTADILTSLNKAGEQDFSRKVKEQKTKLDSIDKKDKKYQNSVKKLKRLLFECDQLLNAKKKKEAATSKEEKANWEKGCDDHYGVVNYHRHIRWALGEYKENPIPL